MNVNAAWETTAKNKHICRWFVAWQEVGKGEVAGAVAGYLGGGSFGVERFYAKLKAGKPTALWIDVFDTITGKEVDFDDCGKEALASAEAGLDELWAWNDHEHWNDTDEVVLLKEKRAGLTRKSALLCLELGSAPWLRAVCEKAGLTAAPVSQDSA